MRKYVIASHGYMASGMKSTIEIILGKQENLIAVDSYIDECKDPTPEFEKIINENAGSDIVIMTDMLGGSVNSNAMALTGNPRIHVVAGVNIPTVLAIIMSNENEKTEDIVEHAVEESKNMIVYCNKIELESEEDDF